MSDGWEDGHRIDGRKVVGLEGRSEIVDGWSRGGVGEGEDANSGEGQSDPISQILVNTPWMSGAGSLIGLPIEQRGRARARAVAGEGEQLGDMPPSIHPDS